MPNTVLRVWTILNDSPTSSKSGTFFELRHSVSSVQRDLFICDDQWEDRVSNVEGLMH